jgi:regulator of replication initiation timing
MMIQLLGIAVNGTIAVTCGYLTASNIIEGRKARQTDEELKKLFEAAAADREVYEKAMEVAAANASLAAVSGLTARMAARQIESLKVQATQLAGEEVAAVAANDALRERLAEENRQAAAANAKLQAQLGSAQTEAAEIERLGQEALTKAAEEARILRARLESNTKLKDSMLAKLAEAKAEVEALEAQNLDAVLAIEALDAAIDPEPRPIPGNPNGKSFGRPAPKPAPKAKA